MEKYPMSGDQIVGDAGNSTVYLRPDGSTYALDRSGRGGELRPPTGAPSYRSGQEYGTKILGPARFDSRAEAIRRRSTWQGCRSLPR